MITADSIKSLFDKVPSDKLKSITSDLITQMLDSVPADKINEIYRKIYYRINGGHYDETLALEEVSNLFRLKPDRIISLQITDQIRIKSNIEPTINKYDYYVAFNLMNYWYGDSLTELNSRISDNQDKLNILTILTNSWLKNKINDEVVWNSFNK